MAKKSGVPLPKKPVPPKKPLPKKEPIPQKDPPVTREYAPDRLPIMLPGKCNALSHSRTLRCCLELNHSDALHRNYDMGLSWYK